MYLWKYWRESRILFGVSLLVIGGLFVAVLRERFETNGIPAEPSVNQIAALWMVFLNLQIFPLCFVAWMFGSFGIGRDMGEHSGSFIFSRPRKRAQFMWQDWSFGLLQVLMIDICLNLVIWLQFHRALGAGSIALGHQDIGVPVSQFCGMTCIAAILLTALVFSLTYFSTIVLKSARGVFLSAGVLLGYIVLGMVIRHYWPGLELPSLLLQIFSFFHHTPTIGGHLGLQIAIRTMIVLLFPIAAQFMLERADI